MHVLDYDLEMHLCAVWASNRYLGTSIFLSEYIQWLFPPPLPKKIETGFLKSSIAVLELRAARPEEAGDQNCLHTTSHWHEAKSIPAQILHEYTFFQSKGETSAEPPLRQTKNHRSRTASTHDEWARVQTALANKNIPSPFHKTRSLVITEAEQALKSFTDFFKVQACDMNAVRLRYSEPFQSERRGRSRADALRVNTPVSHWRETPEPPCLIV